MSAVMAEGRGRVAHVGSVIAASLGLAHAAISATWALGSTALLDTVGGSFERWGASVVPPS